MNEEDDVVGAGADPLFSIPDEDAEGDEALGDSPIDPEEAEEEYI